MFWYLLIGYVVLDMICTFLKWQDEIKTGKRGIYENKPLTKNGIFYF
jgi:hypothetical protein